MALWHRRAWRHGGIAATVLPEDRILNVRSSLWNACVEGCMESHADFFTEERN